MINTMSTVSFWRYEGFLMLVVAVGGIVLLLTE